MPHVEAEGIADGLELSGRPSIVLDHTGRVVFETASVGLFFGTELQIVGSGLKGMTEEASAAVAEIVSWAKGETESSTPHLAIHRNGDALPLLLIPMRRIGVLDQPTAARSIVSFIDLKLVPPQGKEQLQSLFGLTRAEADVADLLARGLTVAEIAKARGVTAMTIRGQLKAIFRKLDVNRQSDIVRLVERIGWRGVLDTQPARRVSNPTKSA